jgi:hypothetical protein
MALTDLQRFNEARLSVLLGVPPTLLALPSGDPSTYTNSTNIFDFHWRAGLRPKAASVMGAMSGWLLPRGTAVELDRDAYIRPGMFERSQAYSMLIASGVLTPEEVRVFERYTGDPQVSAAALSNASTIEGESTSAEPAAMDPAVAAALDIVASAPSLIADPGLPAIVAQIKLVLSGKTVPLPAAPSTDVVPYGTPGRPVETNTGGAGA